VAVEAAAKKARVKTEQLEAWEKGESRPTINQLRTLAGIYKRPLAVFYLPEPPQEPEALRDYRRLPDATKPGESPELREEIRRAMFRREVVLELADVWEDAPPHLEASASLRENPERVGARIREILGVSVNEQADWASEWVALRNWRFALEETGVLVFQASGIALREMRGFSLAERPFPVIVLNVKDRPRGRIFTLLHEFTHILLNDSGLCDLEEHEPRPPELQRIERFCDRVAAAALVPRDDFLAQPLVAEKANRPEAWDWYDLRELASRYEVSLETLLGRLLTLEKIDEAFYWRTLRGLQRRYKQKSTSTSSRGPAPPLKAVNNAGQLFSQLVLDSYNEERITASDLSDYLEVRLKHIPSIEDLVHRGAAAQR
jgi:Zn-dependent peptidase ImmA (M78 family)